MLTHLARLPVRWMGGLGHTARVPKAQRIKSSGPKELQLEVGAQRAPTLLATDIPIHTCDTELGKWSSKEEAHEGLAPGTVFKGNVSVQLFQCNYCSAIVAEQLLQSNWYSVMVGVQQCLYIMSHYLGTSIALIVWLFLLFVYLVSYYCGPVGWAAWKS